jgi:hypothetical protein
VGDRRDALQRAILEAREKLDAAQLLGSIHALSLRAGAGW